MHSDSKNLHKNLLIFCLLCAAQIALVASFQSDPTTTESSPEALINSEEFINDTDSTLPVHEPGGSSAESNESPLPVNQTNANTTSSSTSSSPAKVINREIESATTENSIDITSRSPINISTTTNEPDDSESEIDGEEDETTTTATTADSNNGTDSDSSASFSPPQNVSQYMDYIESLFQDLRTQVSDIFAPHIPSLMRSSQMVQLSGSCSYDFLRLALGLRQFEPWALKMIDSSGKMPEGIFEGSFTSLGSYDQCLNTIFASQASHQEEKESTTGSNQVDQTPATKGQYCLVHVSPFLPPKPPADKVERLFQEEANRRNYSQDNQFSRLSSMFYYMKFRIGVCIPSTCDESDLTSISSALSSSLRLNITVPHCIFRHNQPMTTHQSVAAVIFTSIVALVTLATFLDCAKQRLARLKRHDLLIVNLASAADQRPQIGFGSDSKLPGLVKYASGNNLSTGNFGCQQRDDGLDEFSQKCESKFVDRLEKHWLWMSFSMLTNFKLYFSQETQQKLASQWAADEQQINGNRCTNIQGKPSTPAMIAQQRDRDEDGSHISTKACDNRLDREPFVGPISCLDGIRVLSLCWVITANSYITLDPRATKRLTKSREVPKDFLFQLVAQASLSVETFFFLSGLLLSLSYYRKIEAIRRDRSYNLCSGSDSSNNPPKTTPISGPKWWHSATWKAWLQFYVHRYIRMTPATMLVIAFSMFAFKYGDGPLWFEATHKAHQSCNQNWWRHLFHIANFIDTRQMCFIHYWYIAADMQLFLFGPIIMYLLYKRRLVGYITVSAISLASVAFVFVTTYTRNLPPTLLFYNSDPESRREFGNTIMTKPLTHALPYLVGMLLGKWLTSRHIESQQVPAGSTFQGQTDNHKTSEWTIYNNRSLGTLLGLIATFVALAEVFLPYKWNNAQLPSSFVSAIYAALFRLGWSMALAYLVISCQHKKGRKCTGNRLQCTNCGNQATRGLIYSDNQRCQVVPSRRGTNLLCLCGSGGNLMNRFLGLGVFAHLSRLSFVAYLIHLPLMSAFVAQTQSLFAFSHSLVIHLALSYLVMTFILSFILVHFIEFPFITFEKYLFRKVFGEQPKPKSGTESAFKHQQGKTNAGFEDDSAQGRKALCNQGHRDEPEADGKAINISIRL